MSNWYVRRSRTRLQHPENDQEKNEVFGTLHGVLVQVSKTLAPFMPFISEEMYRNLTGEESVHLVPWPSAKKYDAVIIDRTRAVRETISQALALRAAAKIKVRQPLQLLELPASAEQFFPEDIEMIQEEVNVKEVRIVSGDELKLDTTITLELKAEGIARDLIRHVQGLRKQAGYALDDKIVVGIKTDAKEILDAIHQNEEKYHPVANINNEIKGKTVFGSGKVTGKCHIITDYDKIEDLQEGEILVVPSTLPKYNNVYKRAKAIITNEGGVLAHASIFCREFKIPGIVGTKIATKVIKDGDFVEVDADNGIVKILNK